MTRYDSWRWLAHGLQGVSEMLARHHDDPASGEVPDDIRAKLQEAAAKLERVLREQAQRREKQ